MTSASNTRHVSVRQRREKITIARVRYRRIFDALGSPELEVVGFTTVFSNADTDVIGSQAKASGAAEERDHADHTRQVVAPWPPTKVLIAAAPVHQCQQAIETAAYGDAS